MTWLKYGLNRLDIWHIWRVTDVDRKNAILQKLIFRQYFCSKDPSPLNSSLSRLESFVASRSMAWWVTCQGKQRWPHVTCIVATPVFFSFFPFCLLSTFTSACRQVALFLANKVSIKYIWTWMFSYRERKQPILIRISKKLWVKRNKWVVQFEWISIHRKHNKPTNNLKFVWNNQQFELPYVQLLL